MLNSYISFTKNDNFPIEPTPNTLSFHTVYMSHCINPHSVATYLSGISQQLKSYFPSIRESINSSIVWHTLKGCMQMWGTAPSGNEHFQQKTCKE